MTRPTILDSENVALLDLTPSGRAKPAWAAAEKVVAEQMASLTASVMRHAGDDDHTAWDDVRKYVEGLEGEIGRLEDENSELRYEPWPEWARAVLKVIRSHTGYDGYDDATEGVDMPLELSEHLSQIESDTDRWKARAESAEARIAELEKEKHAALTMIAMLEKQLVGKE